MVNPFIAGHGVAPFVKALDGAVFKYPFPGFEMPAQIRIPVFRGYIEETRENKRGKEPFGGLKSLFLVKNKHHMPSAGIEPASPPSEGDILSIELQGQNFSGRSIR